MMLALIVFHFLFQNAASGQDITISPVLLKAMAEVEIPSLQEGAVLEIAVREGDLVQASQLVVQLDDRQAKFKRDQADLQKQIAALKSADRSAIDLAKVELEVANASLQRAYESRKKFPDTPSQAELDMIRLRVAEASQHLAHAEQEFQLAGLTSGLAESTLRSAEDELATFQLKSPIHGAIVEVIARKGEWVRLGSPVARVVQFDRLRAETYISRAQVAKVKSNMVVSVLADLSREGEKGTAAVKEIPARIVFVSPEVDANDDRQRVIAEVDNSQGLLAPGMRVSIRIPTNTTKSNR